MTFSLRNHFMKCTNYLGQSNVVIVSVLLILFGYHVTLGSTRLYGNIVKLKNYSSETDSANRRKQGSAIKFSDADLKNVSYPNLESLPDLIIFRKSKKTGSSSMVTEIIREIIPLGYNPIYDWGPETNWKVRLEAVKPKRSKIIVLEHNDVVRSDFPGGKVIIIDTIRDGYKQVTSYCRHFGRVKTCGSEMEECLRTRSTRSQVRYRWASRSKEDRDTYIDLPLSSAHPLLSSKVLKTFFPNVSLNTRNWNVRNTTCPEIPNLRYIYSSLYSDLEEQVQSLRRRMLIIAGYPYKDLGRNISIEEKMDAAERIEGTKMVHVLQRNKTELSRFSDSHLKLMYDIPYWRRNATKDLEIYYKS